MNQSYWYKSFFNGLALDLWEKAVPQEYTNDEVRFIRDRFSFSAESEILDVACGFGRHLIPLALDGFKMTGMDISEEYVSRAREKARGAGIAVEVIHADIFDFPEDRQFHGIIWMGNGVAYFKADDLQVLLEKLGRLLKSGGQLIINTGAIAELVMPSIRQNEWMEFDDLLFLSKTSYHPVEGYLRSDYRFIQGDRTENKTAFHYVFTLSDWIRKLKQAGFTRIKAHGTLDGDLFTMENKQVYFHACL